MESKDANDVLMVPPDVDMQELHDYVQGTGPVPRGAYLEPFEIYTARGRVADCDCKLIQCICAEARQHVFGCQRRLAMTCAVAISCEEHSLDVCPTCDPCSCASIEEQGNRLQKSLEQATANMLKSAGVTLSKPEPDSNG